MYSNKTGLILGFHGCDKSVVEKIVTQKEEFKKSENDYDWLGNGIYFWENNYHRALAYAQNLQKNPIAQSKKIIKTPAVIGAVIDLGFCLDLLETNSISVLKATNDFLCQAFDEADLPKNSSPKYSSELLIRKRDCLTIETTHLLRKNIRPKVKEYDSVRGVFLEGTQIYVGSGFHEKSHIQLCIRNPNCIKGVFIPRKLNERFNSV